MINSRSPYEMAEQRIHATVKILPEGTATPTDVANVVSAILQVSRSVPLRVTPTDVCDILYRRISEGLSSSEANLSVVGDLKLRMEHYRSTGIDPGW